MAGDDGWNRLAPELRELLLASLWMSIRT